MNENQDILMNTYIKLGEILEEHETCIFEECEDVMIRSQYNVGKALAELRVELMLHIRQSKSDTKEKQSE